MIAIAPTCCCMKASRQTADAFETMLPAIQKVASYAFRRLPRWRREELILDVIAKAFEAFARLVKRGKADLAYPTVLATFAIKQVCDGQQVGVRQNVNDVMSAYAQRQKGFKVQPLRELDDRGQWEELVVEDRNSGPAEVATFRIDFRDWLRRLKRFQRQLALRLAARDSPAQAARHFRLSVARISQLRGELRTAWHTSQAFPVGA